MRIGVFGGTFNPPHLGHLSAAKAAAKELRLDKLLLIPDREPPHKEMPEGSPSPEQRQEMLELAADWAGLGKIAEISDMELRRTGPSYTSDTLALLHEQYPDDELFLLMGTDMFLTVHTWHESAEIMRLAVLAPFRRESMDRSAEFSAQEEKLERQYGAQVSIVNAGAPIEVSSTQLRAALKEGRGEEYLCPSVWGYILRNKLYGTDADLTHLTVPQLRAASYSMIKAKRVPHIRGTEQEAVRLAKRWGVDPEKARLAAILHDCTKYLNLPEQLQLADKYDILLDNVERNTLKLLHAKTGAGIAKEVFGMPEDICEAIRWHTTGKADMTRLEKILYIADYCEPSRDFEEAEILRRIVYRDLDLAVLTGLNMSIAEMESMGNPVHYRTAEARDFLAERIR